MPVSNASLLNLACTAAEIATWTDADTGEAVSTSEVNAPAANPMATVWSFDTNTSADTNDDASRYKDVGSIDGLGSRIVLSLRLYCDAIGAIADADGLQINIFRSDVVIAIKFNSDGLFIYTGAAYVEVGTNLVVQDTWQEWTFDIDVSGGVANAVCDVYLDNVLQASGVDCSYVAAVTDGFVYLYLFGYTTDDRLVYLDWLKIGDGFAAEGTNIQINIGDGLNQFVTEYFG